MEGVPPPVKPASRLQIDGRGRHKMTNMRRDGLYLFTLGCSMFLLLGVMVERISGWGMTDFKVHYYASQCLLQLQDPYDATNVWNRIRNSAGRPRSPQTVADTLPMHDIYPPTDFLITTPIAVLPFRPACLVWMVMNMGVLLAASFLIWNMAATSSPVLAGALIGLALANSATLIAGGNVAATAIGLSIIAAYCFITERYPMVGIFCLACGLMLKPQDAGPIWLFFLLTKGPHRRRALQTLVLALALSTPTFIWVTRVAPHWPRELLANLKFFESPGGFNDPHLSNSIINLQTALSFVSNNPQVYNQVTFFTCGILLFPWMLSAIRSKASAAGVQLGLAAVVPIALLVVYHRTTDAPLLLLSVPALTAVWASGMRIRCLGLLVTSAAFLFTGDVFGIATFVLVDRLRVGLRLSPAWCHAVEVLPAPTGLLALAAFYLWIYIRRPHCVETTISAVPVGLGEMPDPAIMSPSPFPQSR